MYILKFQLTADMVNPASAKLLEEIGADSFNPVRDLQIPMMASIRKSIDISMDLHMENPKSSGGFIRHYEAPEIIRAASPVYLKLAEQLQHIMDGIQPKARLLNELDRFFWFKI